MRSPLALRHLPKALLLALSPAVLVACNQTSTTPQAATEPSKALEETLQILYSFEGKDIPTDAELIWAQASLTQADASEGVQALKIKMDSAANAYTAVTFRPDTPWDWSEFQDFSLAMEMANRGEVSTQIYLDIEDIDNNVYTRTVNVPVGGKKTYYAKMNGHDLATPNGDENIELNFASGLRSNPVTWESDSIQFVSMWGKKNLNLNGIRRITFSVQTALRDKEITIDNLRLIANPPQNEAFLNKIVDKFGQNAKDDFVGKIHSEEEMHAQRDAELKTLSGGKKLSDRSRFSGWTAGPKLEATGFFRTEKVDGKWALVTPDGYLYFATGIDIIRLSNSTTMTGYDFDQSLIQQRSADDTTPEDSMGLNTVPMRAVPSRHVTSKNPC